MFLFITLLGLLTQSGLTAPSSTSLHTKFVQRGKKYFGNIVDTNTLNRPEVTSLLISEFGAVTPEYSMKWAEIEPNPGQFDFASSDAIVGFAQQNQMLVRGHTLCKY
jgi:endo-1,4-beta-xylanase